MRIGIARRHYDIAIFLLAVLLLVSSGCRRGAKLPSKGSKEYNEAVRVFYIGLAALQVGHDVQADNKLAQFTQLAPTEPAGSGHSGLLAPRDRKLHPAGGLTGNRSSARP